MMWMTCDLNRTAVPADQVCSSLALGNAARCELLLWRWLRGFCCALHYRQRFLLLLLLLLQVHEDELEALCDGEGDSRGLIWPLHVRERLPLDILKALPAALKAVSKRDGSGSSSSQQRPGVAAEEGADAVTAGGRGDTGWFRFSCNCS
jgi:hypothetical protein